MTRIDVDYQDDEDDGSDDKIFEENDDTTNDSADFIRDDRVDDNVNNNEVGARQNENNSHKFAGQHRYSMKTPTTLTTNSTMTNERNRNLQEDSAAGGTDGESGFKTNATDAVAAAAAAAAEAAQLSEREDEVRTRILKAQKISFRNQYEHGLISPTAATYLSDLVDYVGYKKRFLEVRPAQFGMAGCAYV